MASQLLATKSIDELQAQDASGNELHRALTATQLTLLGIGGIIGTGIFVLTGTAAANHAGPALALSFIVAGIGCTLAGLCYAEFAAMIPVSGSAYSYSYATLGEGVAWFIGWNLVLEYLFAVATVSVGWSGYATSLLDQLGLHIPNQLSHAPFDSVGDGIHLVRTGAIINVPAMAIVAAIATICYIGIKQSAVFNSVIVTIKVAVIILFILFGMSYINTANWGTDWHSYAPNGFAGIGAGAAYIFFAYIGFDAVSTTAQEAKNPQRDLPIGMIASLAICTVLYIAVAGVLTGMVHWQQINIEAPVAVAFLDRGLSTASHIITLGALAGLTSVMLVMLLGQTRVLYSMANDGLLPKKFFAAVHPKFRTPWKNTILVGLLAAVVGSVTPIDDIGKMVNIGTLLAFVIVSISVMVLRRTNPSQPRPFRTPWVPLVPILGVISNGYMMYKLGWMNWARLIIWLVIGLIVYFTYSVKHSRVKALQSGTKNSR